jgi:hypothetical protein
MKDTQDRKSWQQPSQPLFVVVENDDNEPNQTKRKAHGAAAAKAAETY